MVMPEGIAQIEKAMRRFDIPSLFEGALPVCRPVKRTVLISSTSISYIF
jgi:hypothetical protein